MFDLLHVKKERVMAVAVAVVTLLAGVGLIRWFAPQLLGIPLDPQMARASKEIIPFDENVFRFNDIGYPGALLKYLNTNLQRRPMFVDMVGYKPHDLPGYCNCYIPDVADIVTIEGSQAYCN